ncbi:hypothetical protein EVJ58_g2985 [Rhodofomes roseus]|uniref:DUF6699 domain-containing protein n=1 Tax=Rhodofomes roseus TaxID=34475 RepID=A0A4Y9YQB9_9APHY|nr:hypothetical protein EVJ58_g2985 [Rhodofomes roseus]
MSHRWQVSGREADRDSRSPALEHRGTAGAVPLAARPAPLRTRCYTRNWAKIAPLTRTVLVAASHFTRPLHYPALRAHRHDYSAPTSPIRRRGKHSEPHLHVPENTLQPCLEPELGGPLNSANGYVLPFARRPAPTDDAALASSDLDRPSSVSSFRAPAQAGMPVPVSAVLASATNGGKPRIKWDMACDPLRWAYDRELKDTGLSLVLSEPAASPDVARLLVTISGASYPYEIFVERPTSLTAPLYVSIRDVLVAIFDNLWRSVTAAEQQGAAQQNPPAGVEGGER